MMWALTKRFQLTKRFNVSEGGLEHRQPRCQPVAPRSANASLTRRYATLPPPVVPSYPAPCWRVPVATG